ncbi:MAG TPA: KEOPS complex subunit Pcc1 [Candidatus Methanoperedens sp.]|nr:KEOPS complex subunit Pcc1 [Candidatus Methanoperedens sp.]HLB71893.1 KEOPS complex subunit Pcc1 [Candidatus Methanoperedens sp.]
MMKIKGKLIFRSDSAVDIIARSLAPDNVAEIETSVDENSATVVFRADKIGTMLSSIDDYLMNAKIAGDILNSKKVQINEENS